MSTIYTVSWTVLAAMIGQGGLGTFIYTGISANDNGLILMGAIPAALLAFILGSLIDALQRKVVPKGSERRRTSYDRYHDFRPHLDRCRRLAVCHRGRRPSGNSFLLLSLRPQNYPAGGGPAPDYPCIGPAGHHHGLSGGGKPTVIIGLALYSLLPIVRNTASA